MRSASKEAAATRLGAGLLFEEAMILKVQCRQGEKKCQLTRYGLGGGTSLCSKSEKLNERSVDGECVTQPEK
jgi:hypothetical protein